MTELPAATVRTVTVPERRALRLAAMARGLDALRAELREAAPRLGGHFLLYGSAARGEMRHDSDVDLLLDFPDETLDEAWRAAEEDACRRHDLRGDIAPKRWMRAAFLAHALKRHEMLG